MLTTSNLLSELRANVQELYSAEVQLLIEREINESNKQKFLEQRTQVRNYLHILEKQDLEKFVQQMAPLKAELEQLKI
jgi:hypothetical protein